MISLRSSVVFRSVLMIGAVVFGFCLWHLLSSISPGSRISIGVGISCCAFLSAYFADVLGVGHGFLSDALMLLGLVLGLAAYADSFVF